jgi:hypothetical protein
MAVYGVLSNERGLSLAKAGEIAADTAIAFLRSCRAIRWDDDDSGLES